jgi:hypothetical protein
MTKPTIIRQGDVLIMPCKEIPADLPKVEAEGHPVFLQGRVGRRSRRDGRCPRLHAPLGSSAISESRSLKP